MPLAYLQLETGDLELWGVTGAQADADGMVIWY
jgi:hypothetical protein